MAQVQRDFDAEVIVKSWIAAALNIANEARRATFSM